MLKKYPFELKEYGTNQDILPSLANLTHLCLLTILNANYLNTKSRCPDVENDDEGIGDLGEHIETLYVLCWMQRVSFSFHYKWQQVAFCHPLSISLPTGTTYLI